MVSKVLKRSGSTVQARVEIHKAVAQLVILYVSNSWVVMGGVIKVLKGFHHQVAWWITGMTGKSVAGGEWEYPSVVEEMESAGIHLIRLYIRRRQETIAERVACCPIYEPFMEAERIPGTSWLVRWWDQDAVNEPE